MKKRSHKFLLKRSLNKGAKTRKFDIVMSEFDKKKLYSRGHRVKKEKQALAIAFSEMRKYRNKT